MTCLRGKVGLVLSRCEMSQCIARNAHFAVLLCGETGVVIRRHNCQRS